VQPNDNNENYDGAIEPGSSVVEQRVGLAAAVYQNEHRNVGVARNWQKRQHSPISLNTTIDLLCSE